MFTFSEQERLAYIAGFASLADKYQKCADFQDAQDCNLVVIDGTIDDQIDAMIDAAVENRCPDYAAYKQFFEDCFMRLNGRYPCPSVTSDYDCGVIFAAIDKGEGE